MNHVIYTICNKVTRAIYFGQTVNFEKRKRRHLWELRNGKHPNSHLGRSFNLYGEHAFEIEELESHDSKQDANQAEDFYINYLKFIGGVIYNTREENSGKGFAVLGQKANIGRKQSLEERNKRGISIRKAYQFARENGIRIRPEHHTEERRRKISKGLKIAWSKDSDRRKKTSERMRRICQWTGKSNTPWNKGRRGVYSPEALEKMRTNSRSWNKGRTNVYSIEARRNISEGLRRAWKRRKDLIA